MVIVDRYKRVLDNLPVEEMDCVSIILTSDQELCTLFVAEPLYLPVFASGKH